MGMEGDRVYCWLLWTMIGWLLEFYTLTISKVISWGVLTCGSGHSWQLQSAAPPGIQAVGTLTRYPTQSHFSDPELTTPCPSQLPRTTSLGEVKSINCVSYWFESTENQPIVLLLVSYVKLTTQQTNIMYQNVISPKWTNVPKPHLPKMNQRTKTSSPKN